MLKFTPFIDDTIRHFLQEKSLLESFSDASGGYVNFLFPENMNKNIEGFKTILKKHNLRGKVFFAHKVNKSNSLVSQAENQGINIDVASVPELKRALCNGYTGDRIEITGPKSLELIILAIKHNALFNVDSTSELNSILEIVSNLNLKSKLKVLLRLGSFNSEYIKAIPKDSKFGIPFSEMNQTLQIISENKDKLHFLGLSFHIDTIEIKEKVIAIENCLNFFEIARDFGLEPSVLNLGGGFKVSYIEKESDWNDSITSLKESMINTSENFVWGGSKLGLYNDKGTLRGNLNIYNYFDKTTGSSYLDAILSTPLPTFNNRPVGTVLCENMIDVYIEPGRAMLDQVGITATKITQVKKSPQGELIAVLNIRRTDLVFGDQEIFVDPYIISKCEDECPSTEPIGVYLAGSLCLESDFVYKHKTFVSKQPMVGDIVVFINTAGYYMDFNHNDNSNVNDKKIVITKDSTSFKWYNDDIYNPVIIKLSCNTNLL